MRVQYQAFCANRYFRPRKVAVFAIALVGLFSVAAAGCDEKEEPRSSGAASPSAVASALGIDGAALAAPLVDPTRPAGDLKTEAEKFSTIEACMQEHGRADPVVSDALDHMGYDTLVRDACTVLSAVKKKDAKDCGAIDAGTLRMRCRSLVAIALGKPDQCPMRYEAKADFGREAKCVAAASRTPALCLGEEKRVRPACDALLLHDGGKCAAFVLDEEKDRCTRESLRLASLLEGGTPLFTDLTEGKGTLELHGESGTADPSDTHVDLGPDVTSGVVLVQERKGFRIRFGSTEANLSVRAVAPSASTSFGVTLGVLLTGDADVREAHLSVSGAASITCAGSPGVKCDLKAKVAGKIEPRRGAPINVVIDGVVGAAPHAYKVHVDVKTFARDVVDESTFGP